MTTQPARPERSGPQTASVMDVSPFKPSLVKAVFRDVTSMHVSRSAARAAASVTRTVLTEIIDGARRAAAEEARKKRVRPTSSPVGRVAYLGDGPTRCTQLRASPERAPTIRSGTRVARRLERRRASLGGNLS